MLLSAQLASIFFFKRHLCLLCWAVCCLLLTLGEAHGGVIQLKVNHVVDGKKNESAHWRETAFKEQIRITRCDYRLSNCEVETADAWTFKLDRGDLSEAACMPLFDRPDIKPLLDSPERNIPANSFDPGVSDKFDASQPNIYPPEFLNTIN